ncbi:MAG: prenyltransferase [Methanobacterium sp. PtaB.Bin024]|nr:MAG: prenyltransferase [Methanobacterium sp. PtaB.Bin024]
MNIKYNYSRHLTILINESIYGGYLTALAAPCFVLTTSLVTSTPVDWPILIISYLLPLIVYSYDYHQDVGKEENVNSERFTYLEKNARYYPVFLISYVILLVSLLFLFSSYQLIVFIVIITGGGLLYATVLKGLTKRIPVFKNIYTGLTWSLGGTFFIPFYYSIEISLSFLIVFVCITLRAIMDAIFFDLKDLRSDATEGLKTFPVILGKNNTINFLHSINLISFIPLIVGVYFKILPIYAFALLVFYFYTFYYLKMSRKAIDSGSWGNLCYIADFEFIIWPIFLFGVIMISKNILY